MSKKAYERPFMDVIEFDTEDIIATSGGTPENPTDPLSPYELPVIPNL